MFGSCRGRFGPDVGLFWPSMAQVLAKSVPKSNRFGPDLAKSGPSLGQITARLGKYLELKNPLVTQNTIWSKKAKHLVEKNESFI